MTLDIKIFLFTVLLSSTSYIITVSSLEVAEAPVSWEDCKKWFGSECGSEIHGYIFRGEEVNVSRLCCYELVSLGKGCHEALVKASLKSPIFNYKSNISAILKRSSKIWNHCSSPPTLKCARMKNKQCGQEIGRSIFNGAGIETVSDNCCGELVLRREKKCHDSMVEARLDAESEIYEKNKTQVFEASVKIWNRCALIAQSLPIVKSCKSKLSKSCGIRIGERILLDKTFGYECCDELLTMGEDCNDLLTFAAAALPKHQAHIQKILKNSNACFYQCLQESKSDYTL